MSALLHAVDADVGSIRELWVPSVLLSVSVLALAVFIPALLCLAAYVRSRWQGFFGVVFACAVGMGVFVGLLGYGGTSSLSRLQGIVGMSASFGFVLVVATVPTIWFDSAARRKLGTWS
jgi:hypothetical protein